MAENKSLSVIEKDISDKVMARIKDMCSTNELVLPSGYNAGTALRSAFLTIQETKDKNGKTALEVCTQASVAQSLLNMVIQGLQPSKRQCYFIVYGNQLQLFRSYFGTQSALRRAVPSVYKIVSDLVHVGDEVTWEVSPFGERYVASIDTDPFENRDKPVKFGFCNIFDVEGELLATSLMTWADIQTSWRQSRNYKIEGGVHQKFPEEMAKRTLISRACKNLLNTSLDTDPVVAGAFNATTENEYRMEEQNEIKSEQKKLPTKASSIKSKYGIKEDEVQQESVVAEAEEPVEEAIPEEGPEAFEEDIPWPEAEEPEQEDLL